jgi:DNA-binding NarL/FixJ family response regulator
MPTNSPPIRVLAADDHAVVRVGIAAMIANEPGIALVGEATNGREAVERYAALRPDVVLMDLRMPELDGVAAMERIRRDDPQARIIALTMYEGDVDIHRALSAGAAGYLLKGAPAAELMAAIRDVAAGAARASRRRHARAGRVHAARRPHGARGRGAAPRRQGAAEQRGRARARPHGRAR